MNKRNLLLAGGVLVVAVVAVTATQSSLKGSLSSGMMGMNGTNSYSAPTVPTTPPTMGDSSSDNSESSNGSTASVDDSGDSSSTNDTNSSIPDEYVTVVSPCERISTSVFDDSSPFFGIEKADAQGTRPVAPCFATPFKNVCGDAKSKYPVCGGTCADPKMTCQAEKPGDSTSACTCLTKTPPVKCGEGGAACSGECPDVNGKAQVCALRLVGTKTSCGCESPTIVPCGYYSGVCASDGYCPINRSCDAKTCSCT